MKSFANTKAVVNVKLLLVLLPLVVVLHVASVISTSHPFLSVSLALLEDTGWLCIGLIWVIAFIKIGIQQWGPKIWTKVWVSLRTRLWTSKAKKNGTFVPVEPEQLKCLRNNVQRLGLALHGLSPEQEQGRRTHFQMHGETVPPLPLPPQNATLYAEFNSLVRLLNHLGFPYLESVRLQQKDLVFLQQWGSDLEARLRQQQKRVWEQQAALRIALATVAQQHKTLGDTCALAQNYSGYQRIKGALLFLENMVNDQRCPWDLAQTYVQKLQNDMNTLMKQFEQAEV